MTANRLRTHSGQPSTRALFRSMSLNKTRLARLKLTSKTRPECRRASKKHPRPVPIHFVDGVMLVRAHITLDDESGRIIRALFDSVGVGTVRVEQSLAAFEEIRIRRCLVVGISRSLAVRQRNSRCPELDNRQITQPGPGVIRHSGPDTACLRNRLDRESSVQ